MKALLIGAFVGIILSVILIVAGQRSGANPIDADTARLCREYANRDHEKELAPERWAWKAEEWKNFDWYNSCLDHVRYPVAR